MFAPPSTFCGFAARPRGNVTSSTGGSTTISLRDDRLARATFLRWNLADFEISDPELAALTGWFQTIVLEMEATQWHLVQGNSTFWTTLPEACIDAILSSRVRCQSNRPKWKRRPDHYWPHIAGAPLPFLGQGSTEVDHIYLFGDIPSSTLAAHVDHRDAQDVEDHYDEEARRNGSAV